MGRIGQMGECGTCRFYDARLRGLVWHGPYLCRRYPSTVQKRLDEWCGEYQPKEATDDE
jgi:hypothetical protein